MSPCYLLVLLAAVSLAAGAASTESRTAMPEGASVTFHCDSSSWIKEAVDKTDMVLSLGTQLAPDVPGGVDKYRLLDSGRRLTVFDLRVEDTGVFKCKNFKHALTVARNPVCAPTNGAFEEGVERKLTCGGIAAAPDVEAAPRVDWRISDDIVHSVAAEEVFKEDAAAAKDTSTAGAAASEAAALKDGLFSVDYNLIPKFSDNGKSVGCVLEYPNWNASYPRPSCGLERMDIKFEPRISCPEVQYLNENNTKHVAFCEILGNPRPNEGSIFWKTDNNDRVYLDRKDRKQEIKDLAYGIRSLVYLTHSLFGHNLTVNVPHAGKIMTKKVAPILVSGPYLNCPRSLRVRRDNKVEVVCEIRAEPLIPPANVSWTVGKGEKPVKQKASSLEKAAYGQDAVMIFDLSKFVDKGDDEIIVDVKVAGIFVSASKRIAVVLKDTVSVEETISNINDWVNQNAGLLLMAGALFLIGLLTFVVVVVAYRKGLLCCEPAPPSYNRPMSKNARIPSATLLDALNDLEYKAARGNTAQGNRRSSFTFYPGTVNSASVPLTQGRESVDNFEWSHGFSKLANALIAKDTDQDGYIQTHDALATVKTYSQIYRLHLDDSTVNNAMMTCSNGAHVDVESLTRLLASAHDAQA